MNTKYLFEKVVFVCSMIAIFVMTWLLQKDDPDFFNKGGIIVVNVFSLIILFAALSMIVVKKIVEHHLKTNTALKKKGRKRHPYSLTSVLFLSSIMTVISEIIIVAVGNYIPPVHGHDFSMFDQSSMLIIFLICTVISGVLLYSKDKIDGLT